MDNDADSVQSYLANKYTAEQEEEEEEEEKEEEKEEEEEEEEEEDEDDDEEEEDEDDEEEDEDDEEEDRLMEENSDCLVAIDLNSKPGTSAFDDDLVTHDDGLPAMNIQSSYPVRLELLDNAIADEIDKKVNQFPFFFSLRSNTIYHISCENSIQIIVVLAL